MLLRLLEFHNETLIIILVAESNEYGRVVLHINNIVI